jgi:hypothetical protein
MTKQLLWKEWRRNQAVFILVVLSIAMMSIYYLMDNRLFFPGFFFPLILIPLYAAGTMANLFDKRMLDFLLLLPISKKSIWWTQISFGLGLIASVMLIYIFSLLVPEYLVYHRAVIITKNMVYAQLPFILIVISITLSACSIALLARITGEKTGYSMALGIVTALGGAAFSILYPIVLFSIYNFLTIILFIFSYRFFVYRT